MDEVQGDANEADFVSVVERNVLAGQTRGDVGDDQRLEQNAVRIDAGAIFVQRGPVENVRQLMENCGQGVLGQIFAVELFGQGNVVDDDARPAPAIVGNVRSQVEIERAERIGVAVVA